EFLHRARAIVAAADDASDAMKEHRQGKGSLRVGAVCGVLAAGELTIPILKGLRDTRPGAAFEAHTLSFVDQIGPLLTGAVDLALVRGPIDHPDIDLVPLAFEPRVLLVARDSDFANETELAVEDVLDEPTIGFAAPTTWSSFWQLEHERGGPNLSSDLPP